MTGWRVSYKPAISTQPPIITNIKRSSEKFSDGLFLINPLLTEQIQCLDEHHHYAVSQRDADQSPTPPNRKTACRNFFLQQVGIGNGGFVIGIAAVRCCFDVGFVVFFMNRSDGKVAQQSDNQQSRHDIHGNAICLRGGNTAVDLALADIVH